MGWVAPLPPAAALGVAGPWGAVGAGVVGPEQVTQPGAGQAWGAGRQLGCWASTAAEATRCAKLEGHNSVAVRLLWSSAWPFYSNLTFYPSLTSTLSPPSSGPHHLQNKGSCQEGLRDRALTSIVLSGGLCLPPPSLPPPSPCLQVSKQACPKCPHLTLLSGISVCPPICNWELQRGHIFFHPTMPDPARLTW